MFGELTERAQQETQAGLLDEGDHDFYLLGFEAPGVQLVGEDHRVAEGYGHAAVRARRRALRFRRFWGAGDLSVVGAAARPYLVTLEGLGVREEVASMHFSQTRPLIVCMVPCLSSQMMQRSRGLIHPRC